MSSDDPKPIGRIGPPRQPAPGRPYFVWKPAFEVGVATVDEEHRHLFELANMLHASMAGEDAPLVARQVLSGMAAHARCHFDHEEACLVAAACPFLDLHREEHRRFSIALYRLRESDSPSPVATFCFVRDWIVEHVLGMDRSHSPWMVRPPSFHGLLE